MLTKTEERILALVGDGLTHSQLELIECIGDPLATGANLKRHVYSLRQKLKSKRQDIVCLSRGRGKPNYRLVALITTDDT